jgi:branched-chain amino acid transport system permease protein
LFAGGSTNSPERSSLAQNTHYEFNVIAQMVVSGALMGLVYALIAYGFSAHLRHQQSINFGQERMVMLSAFQPQFIELGRAYWLMIPGLLFGV